MSQAALEADALCVDRGGKRVLDGVSFRVEPGEVFALLGGNGAGKSTTLLTFLGFVPASGGTAHVLGRPVATQINDVRRNVAYLPESVTLYGHLSAFENLDYFLSLAKTPADSDRLNTALDTVRLADSARREPLASYSKGMRQKVAIALALLRDAPILLLDEPTSGLDPIAIDEFNGLIGQLAEQGRTVVMVTHDVYGACQVARRVGLLRRGQLVGDFLAPEGGRIPTESVHRAFAEQ
ncbi:MAG: ABC transporter ATP-binding protein [Pseudomonadota bacterium]